MPDQLQLRGGTTTEHNTFTGASKEVTIDTTKKTAVVHDGSTAGGNPLLREDGSNSALALGSQGTPSLKFTGDTNTGIYSPGADQVAISTGGSARLYIAADGDVGVGTTSPASILHLSGSSDQIYTLQTTTSGADNRINFRNSGGTDAGGIWYKHNGNHLIFNTGGSNGEKVRIDGSGRVGIGTSSPGSYEIDADDLVVANTGGNAGLTIHSASTGVGSIYFADGTTGTEGYRGRIEYNQSVDSISFGTAGSGSKLLVDSSGNVGIGTTSPSFLCSVEGSSGSTSVAEFKYSGGNNVYLKLANASNSLGFIGYESSDLTFYNNNSESVRIDSSGRLLVGTSTSRVNGDITGSFQLSGNVDSGSISQFVYANDIYGPRLSLGKSRGTTDGTFTVVQDGDNLGTINFSGADGTDLATRGAAIAAFVDGTPGSNDIPGRLVFSTADGAAGPTERMRISSDGHTYWTTSAPSTTAFGTSIGRANVLGFIESFRNGNGTNVTAQFGGNSGYAQVMGDGDLENTNNSYTGLSDIKLKENIVDANSQWDDLKAFQVRNYNFKAETGFNTHTQIGLIAQEVELVSPGLVGESIDDETGESTKSVNYSVLYMKAVKALQEAMERIETLEAKVAALEAQ